jgi:hypothetical protein
VFKTVSVLLVVGMISPAMKGGVFSVPCDCWLKICNGQHRCSILAKAGYFWSLITIETNRPDTSGYLLRSFDREATLHA